MSAGDLSIVYMPLDELVPDDWNPKGHAIAELRASIGRFGFAEAIVVDGRTGKLAAGHGRVEALAEMRVADETTSPPGIRRLNGAWLAPVQVGWSSKNDEEAHAFLVAANRTTELGGWDDRALVRILSQLDAGPGFAGVGYDSKELVQFMARISTPATAIEPPDPDDAPPLAPEPRSQRGDVWILGEHRLLCGDASNPDDVASLMLTKRADMIWTDPPYGVAYVGGSHAISPAERLKAGGGTIENDSMTAAALETLLIGSFARAIDVTEPGAHFYSAGPPGPLAGAFFAAIAASGLQLHEVLVWLKDRIVMGHSDYHYRHEFVFYGYVPGGGRSGRGRHKGTHWRGGNDASSVLEYPMPRRSADHPTMKPIGLIAQCIANSSLPGDVVYDPFVGSGSTVIAAHRSSRVARAIDVDPRYVDVVCRRFQEQTGIVPVLERSGEPLDFLAT